MVKLFARMLLCVVVCFCICGNFLSAALIIEGSLALPKVVGRPTTFLYLAGDEQLKWNRLKSWITDNGGFVSETATLGISNESGYRGIFAVEDIPKDTVLARIPKAVILKDTPEIQEFATRAEAGSTYVPGLLALAREAVKGVESHWHPYIEMFPTMEDYIQFHPLAKIISLASAEQREDLVAPWNELLPRFSNKLLGQASAFDIYVNLTHTQNTKERMFDDSIFARETILLANMIRQSRMWAEYGYLPYMDLFNHRNENYGVDLKEDNGDWLMVVRHDIKAGEEIYDNYGVHDNQQLFGSWGFCDWNKIIRYKRIPIDVHRTESVLGHAVDFLLQKQHKTVGGLFFVADAGFTPAIHKLLRTSSLNARDLGILMQKYPEDPAQLLGEHMVSLDNEAVTIAKGVKLARIVKADYVKSVEEYRQIAREATDSVLSILAKICVEDLEVLASFESTAKQSWSSLLEQQILN